MELMLGRFANLQLTYDAFKETGIYFLIKTQSSFASLASIAADDIGIYYFIPSLMNLLSFSLEEAINVFFYGLLGMSFFIAFVTFYFQSDFLFIIYAIFSFFLLYREGFFRLTDTYIAPVACTFFLIPLFLLLFQSAEKMKWYHYLFMAFAGFVSGYSHYIRIYSSLAPLCFIISFVLLLLKASLREQVLLLTCFILGLSLPVVHMRTTVRTANVFLKDHKIINNVPYTHPLWHNIYAGLGYMENYLEIKYEDECARKAAEKICPDVEFCSKEYEKILRKEVIRIALKERFLFGSIVFAKLGVILFFILACANIGLIAAYFYPKGFLEYIFWIAMSISALPGLMVVPRPSYLSGLASFAFVYGIFSIIYSYKKFLILKNKKRV